MTAVLVFRGECFRRGDVNTRRRNGGMDDEELCVTSIWKNVVETWTPHFTKACVFVDAFANDRFAEYESMWKRLKPHNVQLFIRIRKRILPTQKEGVLNTIKWVNSLVPTYDVMLLTRNNISFKMRLPVPEYKGRITAPNLFPRDICGGTRMKSSGKWHDMDRVNDTVLIVCRSRVQDLVDWLERESSADALADQGMHQLSDPVYGLKDVFVMWDWKLHANTSMQANPLYKMVGRPEGTCVQVSCSPGLHRIS